MPSAEPVSDLQQCILPAKLHLDGQHCNRTWKHRSLRKHLADQNFRVRKGRASREEYLNPTGKTLPVDLYPLGRLDPGDVYCLLADRQHSSSYKGHDKISREYSSTRALCFHLREQGYKLPNVNALESVEVDEEMTDNYEGSEEPSDDDVADVTSSMGSTEDLNDRNTPSASPTPSFESSVSPGHDGDDEGGNFESGDEDHIGLEATPLERAFGSHILQPARHANGGSAIQLEMEAISDEEDGKEVRGDEGDAEQTVLLRLDVVGMPMTGPSRRPSFSDASSVLRNTQWAVGDELGASQLAEQLFWDNDADIQGLLGQQKGVVQRQLVVAALAEKSVSLNRELDKAEEKEKGHAEEGKEILQRRLRRKGELVQMEENKVAMTEEFNRLGGRQEQAEDRQNALLEEEIQRLERQVAAAEQKLRLEQRREELKRKLKTLGGSVVED
ncbi:hypothetical protein HDV00_002277 [Rhizophlyctis rosea]|nr:hypothetical protein HDV00_002277 [Rhizophlyctis rosea]